VVGSEVSILLATGVHPHHYDKGWHPTATLGVFGGTAGAARLLGLNAAQTARALAIAVNMLMTCRPGQPRQGADATRITDLGTAAPVTA
jgi:2-methylcitrate dehydratase PrpD